MGFVWLAGWAGLLAASGWLAAGHAFRQPRGLPRVLGAAVVAWAWATIGLQVLGATGFLDRTTILVWAVGGLSIGLVARRRRPAPDADPGPWAWDLPASMTLALLIMAFATLMAPSLLLPAKVVSDGPIYHLYFAAKWWKAGRIVLTPSPFGETAAPYFPAGGDLLFAGLMAVFGGDRPARVGQAPFLVLGFLATVALARRMGASLPSSVVASAWAATSLPLILFGFEANVDAIFVAGYVLAVYFGIRYALDRDGPSFLLAGLAAGLAGGTKPTSILFIPPLLALGSAIVLARPIPRRRKARDLAILLAAAAAPWASWFARNALLTGNPLYPLHLEALGRVLLRGWFPASAMRVSPYYLDAGDWRSLSTIVLMVVDPRLAPAWGLALAGAWRWGRSRGPLDRWVWGLAALAAANVGTYWLLIPYRTQQRFLLQALGLAAVPLARLLDRGAWLRWAGVGLLAIHLLTDQAWPFDPSRGRPPWALSERVPSSAPAVLSLPIARLPWRDLLADPAGLAYLGSIAWIVAGSTLAAWRWGRAGSPRGLRAASAATIAAVGGYLVAFEALTGARRVTFPAYAEYQAAWAAVDRVSPPRGWRVAYAGTNLPYYLMGSGLRNDVQYVNIDAHRDWLLHDYHREAAGRGDPPVWDTPRPGWDRIHPDLAAWMANLRGRRIDLLVVARSVPEEGLFNVADAEEFPIERVWADAHPEVFERIFPPREGTGSRMRVYRVRKSRESATDRPASRP